MKKYSRLVAPEIPRQLVAGGFLTADAHDASITHRAPPGLLIRQVEGNVVNSAFDLNCGHGTGIRLDLHVAVDLPAFSIRGWELDVPWEADQIEWLPEPDGDVYPYNMYTFHNSREVEYPQDEVINHRRMLRRGHGLHGLLLGRSLRSIPDSYQHGATIDASLMLIDEMGREFSTPVQLWIDRIAKIDRKPRKKSTRRPLFENDDYAEAELIQT